MTQHYEYSDKHFSMLLFLYKTELDISDISGLGLSHRPPLVGVTWSGAGAGGERRGNNPIAPDWTDHMTLSNTN